MTLRLTIGDTPTLTGTINAATIGASGEVHVRRADATVISRAATSLTDNGDGTSAWSLDLVADDLTVSGPYTVEVQVTFSDATIQTFAADTSGTDITFLVRQQIA